MLNTIKNVVLLFVLPYLLFSANTFGQASASATSCGTNRINLEDTVKRPYSYSVGNPKGSQFTQETMIIIIASLGAKETDRKHNVQRAEEVKKYLTSLVVGIPDELIVLAQGEKRKDEGRVDIYYGGTLQMYITFKPKERLYLTGGPPCMY